MEVTKNKMITMKQLTKYLTLGKDVFVPLFMFVAGANHVLNPSEALLATLFGVTGNLAQVLGAVVMLTGFGELAALAKKAENY